ncbi:hypothetical protein TM102_12090 [Bradyrhizobium sp. TM102]|nr:hypothetical protein TM102_12090 [Bradyrhizobium sp. TM102]
MTGRICETLARGKNGGEACGRKCWEEAGPGSHHDVRSFDFDLTCPEAASDFATGQIQCLE